MCPDCGKKMEVKEIDKRREEYHCKNPKCRCEGGCKAVRLRGDKK